MSRVILAVLLGLAAGWYPAQQPFDATVATVNGEVIYRSDILWQLALDPTLAPEDFWKSENHELMLRTLIDQRLLLQDATRLPETSPSDSEVGVMREQLAARFNSTDDPTRFERRLQLVGLSGPRLNSILADRIRITKFVDFRFRSFVVVTEPEIVEYFDTEIRPQLPDSTEEAARQVLAARRAEIELVLTEEKINAAIDVYLEQLRARADVTRLP
jgi:hypothetical protein